MPEDIETCKRCGGKCCKYSPGALAPEDVSKIRYTMKAKLKALLLTGNYIFDYWDGQFDNQKGISYYLRVATIIEVNEGRMFLNGAWGGPCRFLTPIGCALPYEERPRNCRELVPNPLRFDNDDESCEKRYWKETALVDWYKYQDLIEELVAELKQERSVS